MKATMVATLAPAISGPAADGEGHAWGRPASGAPASVPDQEPPQAGFAATQRATTSCGRSVWAQRCNDEGQHHDGQRLHEAPASHLQAAQVCATPRCQARARSTTAAAPMISVGTSMADPRFRWRAAGPGGVCMNIPLAMARLPRWRRCALPAGGPLLASAPSVRRAAQLIKVPAGGVARSEAAVVASNGTAPAPVAGVPPRRIHLAASSRRCRRSPAR